MSVQAWRAEDLKPGDRVSTTQGEMVVLANFPDRLEAVRPLTLRPVGEPEGSIPNVTAGYESVRPIPTGDEAETTRAVGPKTAPRLRVTMRETTTYEHDYSVEQLAELLGVEETVEAVTNALPDDADSDVDLNGDLLDNVLDHFDSCEDREWSHRIV